MAKHFSKKERKQIIEQLCEIGHKEFTLRGLRAARIEDICRAAGISKGSFYNFFPAKEQLFLAIIENRETVHRNKLTQLAKEFEGDESKLAHVIFDAVSHSIESDPFIAVMMQPGEMEHLARKIGPEQMAAHQQGDFEFFAALTADLQSRGFFKSASPNLITELSVLVFCTFMQKDLLPAQMFDTSVSHLRDLFQIKLVSSERS